MSAVAQFAKLAAKPGCGQQLLDALQVASKAAAEEPGTLMYVCHVSLADPDTVWMYEVYRDAEAQQSHSGSEATAQLRAALGDLLREPLAVDRTTPVWGLEGL